MRHTNLSQAAAYDTARKELYRHRHSLEVERRVAREEALATGAFFAPGPLERGMKLEDEQYEVWRSWARGEAEVIKQSQDAAYSGPAIEEDNPESSDLSLEQEETQEKEDTPVS
jgi:small subunit ribosomal protein S23